MPRKAETGRLMPARQVIRCERWAKQPITSAGATRRTRDVSRPCPIPLWLQSSTDELSRSRVALPGAPNLNPVTTNEWSY